MGLSTAELAPARSREAVTALRHMITGQTWVLPPRPTLLLGAASECDVAIPEAGVSGAHAQLVRTGAGWRLHDCSRNGTFLAGERAAVFDIAVGTRFDVARSPLLALSATMQGGADPLALYLGLDQSVGVSSALLAARREATIVIVGPRGNGQSELAHLLHHLSPRARQPCLDLDGPAAAGRWAHHRATPAATAILDLQTAALAEPIGAARAALLGAQPWRWVVMAASESQACAVLQVPHLRGAHLIVLRRLDERTDDRRALVERLLAQVAPVSLNALPAKAARILLAPRWFATLDELRSLVRQVGTLAVTGVSANAAQALGLHREHLDLLAEKLGFPPGPRR